MKRMNVRAGLVLAGVMAGTTLFGLAGAGTASAADGCVAHPSDPSVACVRNNQTVIDACDRDADGHYAWARVRLEGMSSNTFISTMQDDSAPGCIHVNAGDLARAPEVRKIAPNAKGRVAQIAVCVSYEGCSAYKSV